MNRSIIQLSLSLPLSKHLSLPSQSAGPGVPLGKYYWEINEDWWSEAAPHHGGPAMKY